MAAHHLLVTQVLTFFSINMMSMKHQLKSSEPKIKKIRANGLDNFVMVNDGAGWFLFCCGCIPPSFDIISKVLILNHENDCRPNPSGQNAKRKL